LAVKHPHVESVLSTLACVALKVKECVLTASPDTWMHSTRAQVCCGMIQFGRTQDLSRIICPSFACLPQNVPTLADLQHKRVVVRSYASFFTTQMAFSSLVVEQAHVPRP